VDVSEQSIHGSADRPIAAEYVCPVHGRFTQIVDRDANGDPPESTDCRVEVGPTGFEYPCDKVSGWVISAPLGAVRRWT
jgi:hypothetical protein